MSNVREILTFQFGTYANYVGAHFWNQQEANFVYDDTCSDVSQEQLPCNDILYREGLNDQNRVTYTPRMLSVDLAGTLGHLPLVGELYGNYVQRDDQLLTDELIQQAKQAAETELDVREQPAAPMSEYQRDLIRGQLNLDGKNYQLAETTQSWADFLYARYHPRTINVLHQLRREPDVQTLSTHAAGVNVWQAPAFNEDFCDRIRLYLEECDALQGFQLLFDIDDGFSGLATKCLEHLNDEYSRVSFALPLHYPRSTAYPLADTRISHSLRVLNTVLSYQHLIEQASMFTPLCTLESLWRPSTLQSRKMPALQWQSDNLYQTSAMLASYVDTISLGYRLRQSSETLLRLCDRMCLSGRKLTAAALALPLGLQQQQDLIDFLDQRGDEPLLTQLTPSCEPGSSYVVQSVVARGIPASRLKRPPEQAGPQLRLAAYSCNSISHMLQLYYQCAYHNSLTHAVSTPLPLKTQLPFPHELFHSSIDASGFQLRDAGNREPNDRVLSAPVLAALQSSSRLGEQLDTLHAQTHRIQFAKLQRYTQAGLERDEYETALDKLLEFRDNYAESQYL